MLKGQSGLARASTHEQDMASCWQSGQGRTIGLALKYQYQIGRPLCSAFPKGKISSEPLPLSGISNVSGAQSSTTFISREEFSAAISGLRGQFSGVLTGLKRLGCKHDHSSSPLLLKEDEVSK